MIDLADNLEELREMCRSMTAEKLNAFMKERGYDYTFEDVEPKEQLNN